MASVRVIQTGGVLVSPAVPDRGSRSNPLAYTGLFQSRKNRIEVPVKCFLVSNAGHLTLVDAGWSARDAHDAVKHMGFPLWFSSEPVLAEKDAADRQLEALGIKPQDLDAIVMTHLDCDHAAGLDAFTEVIRVLVAPQELEAAAAPLDPRYNPGLWDGIQFETVQWVFDDKAPFRQSADLYGDGSLVAYCVPGHSKGSLVLIATDAATGDFVVFTGDTGYEQKSWDELMLPGVQTDARALREGLAWIQSLRTDPHCVGTFAAHDPAVKPGVYEF
ncbi:MBL fold metallo-hydrolase [Olsenella sp. YH-ols2217]|uniref:MBL fold metallo-hydrolase n=1 Tax=Kribbibacterium absianum TaxID=3044210 RepID=A0ABT6ZMS1_9ACTN|nr:MULTISPECIES: MBL fold metallo-hydrolase [unclassified Olsenella]MDJ1121933.1 MBL fold metallo-hydrolase [Olsenella sp. YH-ols2216]MDJ1129941.1 MBL fold metallo-hydrolase [Olsenella sp. YH-ols2217]